MDTMAIKLYQLITLRLWLLLVALNGCNNPVNTVTDVDGNIYHTVLIGDQEWMTENLKTTRYNDGTPIAYVVDVTDWRNIDEPAYVWYENNSSYEESYGALYNWHAVGDPKGLCPDGWRVATDEDWKELELLLGMNPEQIEGTGLRCVDYGAQLK